MKKPSCILLVLTAAMMLFAFGCAIADVTDGLVYGANQPEYDLIAVDGGKILKSQSKEAKMVAGD